MPAGAFSEAAGYVGGVQIRARREMLKRAVVVVVFGLIRQSTGQIGQFDRTIGDDNKSRPAASAAGAAGGHGGKDRRTACGGDQRQSGMMNPLFWGTSTPLKNGLARWMSGLSSRPMNVGIALSRFSWVAGRRRCDWEAEGSLWIARAGDRRPRIESAFAQQFSNHFTTWTGERVRPKLGRCFWSPSAVSVRSASWARPTDRSGAIFATPPMTRRRPPPSPLCAFVTKHLE